MTMNDWPSRTVTVYIDGMENDVRELQARFLDDQPKKAFIDAYVICKFRYGNKLHTSCPVAWLQPDGRFRINRREVIHNRDCCVIGWKDSPEQTNSGWTG